MQTLSQFYDSPKDLTGYIQEAMLFMILLLEHEPEHTGTVIKCYEHLYILQNILQKELINQQTNK